MYINKKSSNDKKKGCGKIMEEWSAAKYVRN